MLKLTNKEIRAWIKSGERFEGKADGNGLIYAIEKPLKTRYGVLDISLQVCQE
ncbi:protein of unknown function [Xenorhabdus nematophila AN6/1]|nr:hypothetical protein XNW1_4710029 [Xenorhabdus nematophila str. Websteri]CEK21203.1 protein of unknown function [Xenorhabdus nematophila AN6/1]